MLKNTCPNPACKNMYVTSVHGCCASQIGRRTRASAIWSKAGRNFMAKKMATLRKMIRLTQGVSMRVSGGVEPSSKSDGRRLDALGSEADRPSIDPPLDRAILHPIPLAL